MNEQPPENMPDNAPKSTLEGPRPARIEERDELIAMINFVFRTSTGRKPTIGTDWAHVYAPANLPNVAVVTDAAHSDRENGAPGDSTARKIVASTGVWMSEVMAGDSTLRVGGINCVGTLPDYRRHGLGSQVMAAAHQTMRDLGCHVGLLSTGIMNWYRRMGWEDAGMMRDYHLNRGNVGLLPQLSAGQHIRFVDFAVSGGEVPSVEEEQAVAGVVRLHNSARLGAVRTTQSFRQLTTARQVNRIVLAESQNGPVAYLLLHENTVVEWAGAAEDVAGLVRSCFETLDYPNASTSLRERDGGSALLRTLRLHTPGWQHPLVNLLDTLRLPYDSDYLGMVYVIEPQAILNAYGYDLVRVKEVEGEFNITYKGERITLNRNQLSKLLFGPERISAFATEIFPLPFWQWGLEKV